MDLFQKQEGRSRLATPPWLLLLLMKLQAVNTASAQLLRKTAGFFQD
jgi:hypothetical protein